MTAAAIVGGATLPAGAGRTNQLPFWPEHKRAVPNGLARSALFRVANRKQKRVFFEAVEISSQEGIKVEYTGHELRQDDADVFLQILHLMRDQDPGASVEFTCRSMLLALRRTINNKSQARLQRCLQRLVATALTYTDGGGGYCGSLLHDFVWKDEASGASLKTWRVRMNPNITSLFGWAAFTTVDWEIRLSLTPMAKWLHMYLSTHAKPFPIKLETILSMSGSRMSLISHFRAEIQDALEELKEREFLIGYSISDAGLITVTRNPDHLRSMRKNDTLPWESTSQDQPTASECTSKKKSIRSGSTSLDRPDVEDGELSDPFAS